MAEHRGIMLLGMQNSPNYGTRYTDGFANIYNEVAYQGTSI
ncbi:MULTISPECIES: hypothetical protein [unclassified Oceanobacter]|nr:MULTISPECIES: hypothetical protein [unclassified Oceanobacter]MDP2504986.1 hypothetical protein [Oceanobacter sp. 3_MG-2023]MDP2548584.1 hypothetical protein [Oceanobacter sp. 4_MG-2023]